MAIAVMFDDNKVDYAPKTYFDLLLDTGCIVAFKRSDDEWVDIYSGPVRKKGTQNKYQGPERRERIQLFGHKITNN
ncbi:MAG: hypothetical protein GJV46_08925 [Geobacter sp.]|nr:hypothetical protein [Geobacter sp.]